MGAYTQKSSGFTLVEISIVMIIIGLLIGGTFGGMKLVENMQVNRTVQDLKSIESAALTFKDTYGRLPGDMPNTAARLPNCTDAPCATGGNGNRRLDYTAWNEVISSGMEKFAFWHHLQAADLMNLAVQNTTSLEFGEGQPEAPFGGGYRMVANDGALFVAGSTILRGAALVTTPLSSAAIQVPATRMSPCGQVQSVDRKIDDGMPYTGLLLGWSCATANLTAVYDPSILGAIYYDLKGF